jgi:hypothetical protein
VETHSGGKGADATWIGGELVCQIEQTAWTFAEAQSRQIAVAPFVRLNVDAVQNPGIGSRYQTW